MSYSCAPHWIEHGHNRCAAAAAAVVPRSQALFSNV